MVDTTIRIIVDPSGAVRGTRVVQQQLGATTTKAQGTTNALGALRRAAAALGIALGVRELINYADAFTEIQNRLKVAGVETQSLGNATERLRRISRETRTDISANAALFQRLGIAQQQLGASSEQLFQFVENVGRGLAIQGGAAASASGAILQLSQAVGSGIVRAEEFNSILEGAFPIALAAARGIERTGGSVARLRTEINAGTVTSSEFFEALLSQSDALEEQFGRTAVTVSQAFTVLNNEVTFFIGNLDTSEGFSGALADAILFLADNLDTATRVAGVFAAALAPAIFVAIAGSIASAALAVGAFVVALGPIGVLATVLSAAAAAAFLFGDTIFPITGSIATLQDVTVATFSVISEELGSLIDLIEVGFLQALDDLTNSVATNGDTIGQIFNNLTSFVRTFANVVINSFRVLIEGLAGVGTALILIARGDIAEASTVIQDTLRNSFNIAGEDSVGVLVGAASNVFEAAAPRIRAEAERIARERANNRSSANNGSVNLNNGTITEQPFELTDRQTAAFDKLRDSLEPLAAVQRESALAGELLSQAELAGIISKEEFIQLNNQLSDSFRDQLDPLGAVTRALDEERALIGLTAEQREVENQVRDITQGLRESGVELSERETEALRSEITELQRLNEEQERQQRLLEEIQGPTRDAIANLESLSALYASGAINAEQFAQASEAQRLVLLDQSSGFADGVERGLIRANESIGDFADEAERGIARAFGGAEDAIADFITTTEFNFAGLVDSILDELLRLAIRQAILAPLSQAFQTGGTGEAAGGGGGGGTFGALAGAATTALASFQSGGIQNNPTVANIAEGGPEAIIPLRGGAVPVQLNEGGNRQPPITLNFNISTPNPSEFRASQNQIMSQAGAQLQNVIARNNT